MPNYRLDVSREAKEHLRSIFTYGLDQFGLHQADAYMGDLLEHFDLIAENPLQFASAYVREGVRRCVCNKHSIYYRIVGNTVEIMAVIGQQDIERVL